MQRDLLREYRQLLTANGIDIAYPQVVLNQPVAKTYSVTSKTKEKVEQFIEEQKELSKDMEEQHQ